MKKGLKLLFTVLMLLGLLGIVSAVYGRFRDSVTVTNRIATGDINISLNELAEKGGKETAYKDPKLILPGDCISKIPRIRNLSEPCWVRVKITYKDNLYGLKGLDDASLLGISSYWKKKGDYYYYTKKLDKGETADIFRKVQIPGSWNEAYAGKGLGITIRAEAIQEANFSPDFTAMSPWRNEKIQKCIHDTDGYIVTSKKPVELSVRFDGNAHRLVAAPEDFFRNFSTAMPGDVFQDSAEIRNTTGEKAELFFKTSPECKSQKDQELLRKIRLTISMDGKKLYSGNLLAVKLNKEVSLGRFKPGDGGTLTFTVEVPSALDNAYALRRADVKWIFSVEEESALPTVTPATLTVTEKVTSPDKIPYEAEDQNNIRKTGTASSKKKSPVKTGDDSNTWFLMVLVLISGGACILIIKRGNRIL